MIIRLALLLLLAIAPGQAQAARLSGVVVDARGTPISGAHILDDSAKTIAITGPDGRFSVPAKTRVLEITAPHYAPSTVTIRRAGALRVLLARPLENVVVTAYRTPLASGDSPASTRILSPSHLRHAATPTLDGKLRQIPGFTLYRRSSSLVANPTTEGVSLRGLGSTAASRTLVTFDGVPINDAFGGWIHWEELPSLAVHSVELVRGGASDLYGSSAIGGVIDITPVRPLAPRFQLSSSYGSESTTDDSFLGAVQANRWSGLISGGLIATDGYILIAPSLRGPIDQPSNVHALSGLFEVDRKLGASTRLFLRGNVLEEQRHNGTPLESNRTHLWRYAGGADGSHLAVRFYGDAEHFYQTFSNVPPARTSEQLTSAVEDPADELGASADWRQAVSAKFLLLGGADVHDVRAGDYVTTFVGGERQIDTSARQRQTGVYGELFFTPRGWTVIGSARLDHFTNFNAFQTTGGANRAPLPSIVETIFDPRLGITRRITRVLAVNASAFRAFRAPTENELYRTFQIGEQITLANPNLLSERATGWETGFQYDLARYGSSLRASYFWTQINRPITALTLSATPFEMILQRENLGQIESRGVSIDYSVLPASWVALEGGYQYADATVTSYPPERQLVGKWIPEVARNMATAQLRFSQPKIGLISFQADLSGRQFDDDLNDYLLHGYFRLDIYAQHEINRKIEIFAAGENVFNRTIEVGKTPLTTLGTPRIARIGVRLDFGW